MSTNRVRKGGTADIASLPRGPNGHLLCRYCGTVECRPPRYTFCSEACVREHMIRTRPSYAKDLVYKRDKAICRACGTDTKKLATELWEEGLRFGRAHQQRLLQLHGIPASRKVRSRKWGGGLWDMDHRNAVSAGGGECGLDNLCTLCIPCHRVKTAQQSRERAAARRAKKKEAAAPPSSPPASPARQLS